MAEDMETGFAQDVAPDVLPTPLTINDYGFDDTAHLLSDINVRLGRMEERMVNQGETLNALKEGVNTIGLMINGFVDNVGQIFARVEKDGIGSLLGGLKGKK